VANNSIAEGQLVDHARFCIELAIYLRRTLFNQHSRKHINIIHPLVGHAYSLVPLAMAVHRLAGQMPPRYCMRFPITACNQDLGVTDTLPSMHHFLSRWCTAFARATLNFGILYLWFYQECTHGGLGLKPRHWAW